MVLRGAARANCLLQGKASGWARQILRDERMNDGHIRLHVHTDGEIGAVVNITSRGNIKMEMEDDKGPLHPRFNTRT